MNSMKPRVRIGVPVALALVVFVGVWLVVLRTARGYDTPEQAVTATCQAKHILGNYTPTRTTDIRVGWQRGNQPAGIGWVALVVSQGFGYTVKDCKYQHVTHA
jgi:hypothetical protein